MQQPENLANFRADGNHTTGLSPCAKPLCRGPGGFLVLCRVEKRPPKLDLDVYPYLPRATVARTSAASYMCLVSGDAA